MEIKKSFLTLLIAFASFNCTCQIEQNSSSIINYNQGISTELHYQGKYGMSLGGIIGNNIGSKTKANYTFGMYADAIFADSLIVGPRLKLNWNYLSIFGIGLNFANNYRSGLNDFRFTPEVNFSLFGIASIFAGYSFKLSKTEFSELSEFRIGINFTFIQKK